MESKEIGNIDILLSKIAEGDHTAYRQIFDFYKNKVYSYTRRYLKSDSVSKEVVQEVFLKIWINRDKLTMVDNFGAYLRRVSINATMDELRKIAVINNAVEKALPAWVDSDTSTEDSIMKKDSDAYISILLDQLPMQQKMVFTMCHIDGMKQKDVAKKLDISIFTVKAHLRAALKKVEVNGWRNRRTLLALVFLGLFR